MKKRFLLFLVFVLIAGLLFLGLAYFLIGDNVKNTKGGIHELYIPTNSDYQQVTKLLLSQGIVQNLKSFDLIAKKMNYPNTVEPGKYLIPDKYSNLKLVRMLRNGYGEQAIKVAITNIDSKEELYQKISNLLEVDSQKLAAVFNNDSLLLAHQLTKENVWSIVLSDTYLLNWDTNAETFFNRMLSEYKKYWTADRKAKAAAKGLTPIESIILASIIEKESTKKDEYSRIAGVYINRIKMGMRLQADPTVKFALADPGIKRILLKHLDIDSPYNTYKYLGVPPGPLCLPQKTTIDATLNAENHNFIFFCARADFSGYHDFATNLKDHLRYAQIYQKSLNENAIY